MMDSAKTRVPQSLAHIPRALPTKTGDEVRCGRRINGLLICRGILGTIEPAAGNYPAYIEIPDGYATNRELDGIAVWELSHHAAHDSDGRPRRTPRNKPWTPTSRQGMVIGEHGRGRGQILDDPATMVADPPRRTRYFTAPNLPILLPCPRCGQLNTIEEVLMENIGKITS